MGVDDRHSRPTARFDSRELAKLTEREIVSVPITEVDDAISEWDDEVGAAGTPKQTVPLTSRTATVDDPMTTGVLAQIARQATVEVDREWVLTTPIVVDDDVAHIVDHPIPLEPKPAKR